MSSSRRPWYPWYPKDFVVDEKVQGLSAHAELVYRRALDVMWQASATRLLHHLPKLCLQLGKGLTQQEFESAWNEIQHPGFELFKISDDGQWIYSKRLKFESEKIEKLCKIRRQSGSRGGSATAQANAAANAKAKHQTKKQQPLSHPDPDPDPDIKESAPAGGGLPADHPTSKKWADQVGEWFTKIEVNGKRLEKRSKELGKIFNPWKLIQQLVNERYHPGAIEYITHALIEALPNMNGNPWQYINGFKKTVKQNWNEKEAIEIHEQFKRLDPGQLFEITKGLIKSV